MIQQEIRKVGISGSSVGKSKETRIERDSVCGNFEPSVATPEPVEDDFQKIQGGNGQENHVDALFKGFEGALL